MACRWWMVAPTPGWHLKHSIYAHRFTTAASLAAGCPPPSATTAVRRQPVVVSKRNVRKVFNDQINCQPIRNDLLAGC
jgi:hypothetical protein